MDIGDIYEAIKKAEKEGEEAIKMEKQASKKRISSERRKLEKELQEKIAALKQNLDTDIKAAEETYLKEAENIRSSGTATIEAMKASASARRDSAVEKVIKRLIEE